MSYKSDALATLEMRDQRDVTVMVDELNLKYVYVSTASDPKSLIRAECVRISYAENLTKYEHDHVQKALAALSQRDRDELGVHAYLRESVRVMRAAVDIAGSVEKAIFWFKNNPLPMFDYKTPQDLVSERRTETLIRYIQSLQAGFNG